MLIVEAAQTQNNCCKIEKVIISSKSNPSLMNYMSPSAKYSKSTIRRKGEKDDANLSEKGEGDRMFEE